MAEELEIVLWIFGVSEPEKFGMYSFERIYHLVRSNLVCRWVLVVWLWGTDLKNGFFFAKEVAKLKLHVKKKNIKFSRLNM